ncbi:DUF2059 domain-containing protein [Acuticoccus sp.]|uniref:DUF2059 domain-containing protein n=1 Tax=Acuticoccus sp. TaxID=1904378 RepID=UPI003B516441
MRTSATAAMLAVLTGLVLAAPSAIAQQAPQPRAIPVPVPESGDADITAEHLALAQELIDLTQSDDTFDDILPRLATQTQELFTRQYPALTQDIEEVVYDVALDMTQSRVELSRTLQLVWARRFTAEELSELKTFFTGDVGKKFVELTPSITALAIGAARQWEQTLASQMVDVTRARLREKGIAL